MQTWIKDRLKFSKGAVAWAFEKDMCQIDVSDKEGEAPSLQVTVSGYYDPALKWELANYTCKGFFSEASSPANIYPITYEDEESTTFGYVIPVLALDPDGLEIVEDKFLNFYLSLAFKYIVTSSDIDSIRRNFALTDRQLRLIPSDLVPQNLCIAIISNKIANRCKMDLEQTEFSFLKHFYLPAKRENLHFYKSTPRNVIGSLRLKKISETLRGELNSFSQILETFLRETHLPSRFLILYQLFEVLIERVYLLNIDEVLSDRLITADPWKLREKLHATTEEKSRLNQVLNMSPGGHAAFPATVKSNCAQFIQKVTSEQFDSSKSWIEHLYKVRNLIVHQQPRVWKASAGAELSDICEHLFLACGDILGNYNESNLTKVYSIFHDSLPGGAQNVGPRDLMHILDRDILWVARNS
jgi:hypothetical protein